MANRFTLTQFAVLTTVRRTSQSIGLPNLRPCIARYSHGRLQTSFFAGTNQVARLRLNSIQCVADRRFEERLSEESRKPESDKRIIVAIAIAVVLAVANRVLYKLALVPMKHYPFFLAQLNTFGYVVIYFSILYIRHRAGIVTDEMLAIPKWRFLAIGFLEALGIAAGMASAAVLPGPSIPILSQTFLVWQLVLSVVLLGRRYSLNQLSGCFLVAIGVVIAVASGSKADQMAPGIDFLWPSIMVISSAFQAGASIIKEFIFIDAAKRLKGKTLDIFAVNSFGSGFQALFILLLLPLLSSLKGIPLSQLPSYLQRGAGCLINSSGNSPGCEGAPILPLLYIITNMGFNIISLYVIKISSAVTSSLSVMLSVPLSIYVLSLPLPYLPCGSALSPFFIAGCLILLFGLILYSIPSARPKWTSSGLPSNLGI